MAQRTILDNSQVSESSKQNLVCNWTGSADFGRLVPIHWEELVAGDHVIKCKPRIEMQMLPLASPTFGQIDLYCHFFIVPIRQLLDGFYDMWSQTGEDKDLDIPHTTYYQLQQAYRNELQNDAAKRAAFKHWTSLGLNPCFAFDVDVTEVDNYTPLWDIPFRAYNKIWFDFYRDPEVIRDESKSVYCYTGPYALNSLHQGSVNEYMMPHVRSIKNNWIADLFAQSGLEGLSPVGVDIASKGLNPAIWDNTATYEQLKKYGNDSKVSMASYTAGATSKIGQFDGEPEIRFMEALTRLSERLSLSGKRQIEQLFAHYNVKPRWSEMNLCRYVGGSKSTVLVDNIISNADTADVTAGSGAPLGAKGGVGYCAMNQLDIECSVDEPSILMGIVSVMPHIHYVQGFSKKWQRSSISSMFNPNLQRTGQVAVAKREVALKYRDSQEYDVSHDGDSFAFSDPYYEYKYGQDILAGDFMYYHNITLPYNDPQAKKDILFMQSMEQYIDFPYSRTFNYNNLLVDGDQFNKIFNYLGGSVWEDVDDHFWLAINKDIEIIRPMDGYAVPTIETTENPHAKKSALPHDTML